VENARDAYEILQVHPSALPEVVEAAYRVLALVHHPDRNGNRDHGAMAELNWAYSVLHDPERRIEYDRSRLGTATPETQAAAPAGSPGSSGRPSLRERMQRASEAATAREVESPGNVTIDFGRYAGMTLGQLARTDPGYLEFLRRHSAGVRYRSQIDAVLGAIEARRAAAAAAASEPAE
jgi:curved DNA-binding protein CbpA